MNVFFTAASTRILGVSLAAVASVTLAAEHPIRLTVDFARTNGVIRTLNGINKGPLVPGGLIDLTDSQRALAPPFIRLHDCHWPNPDVVDIHAIFPNWEADPELPESFDFALTDEYIAAVRSTGAGIIYRLGESIEHTTTKRFAHPPKDVKKWALITRGIIRHYNRGWANGFQFNIRYWEIWNEPENRPAMWSGTDADYFLLYQTAAMVLKAEFPEIRIGGPAVGNTGELHGERLTPSAFVTNFLGVCRQQSLPLDFFSWHCYTANPTELSARAKGIRELLDRHGFFRTESHLNEWNFLPGNTWKPISRSASPESRQEFQRQMCGAEGAAFVLTSLLELQDSRVDVCNLFHGETGGFGIFNEYGVPQKNYYALRVFHFLLQTPDRVESLGSVPGKLGLMAGLDLKGNRATIVLSSFASKASDAQIEITGLPWSTPTLWNTQWVDEHRSLESGGSGSYHAGDLRIRLAIRSPAIALISLSPAPLPDRAAVQSGVGCFSE